MAARGREDSRHGASRGEHQRRLIERGEPARRSAKLVAVVRPEMQKSLFGNTLHQTDLIGVRNQEETWPRAADAGEDVVDTGAANILCELAPAPLDPILDRVFVPGWTRKLGKLFHQLEHELDLGGSSPIAHGEHTASIDCSASNRGMHIAV